MSLRIAGGAAGLGGHHVQDIVVTVNIPIHLGPDVLVARAGAGVHIPAEAVRTEIRRKHAENRTAHLEIPVSLGCICFRILVSSGNTPGVHGVDIVSIKRHVTGISALGPNAACRKHLVACRNLVRLIADTATSAQDIAGLSHPVKMDE